MGYGRTSAPRAVAVVAYDGVRFLDVVGPLEVFAVANESGAHYTARVATPGGHDVVTTTGSRLGADVALEELTEPLDILLIAGSPNWSLLLEDSIVAPVRQLAPRADRVVSVCTGSFALAAAGLIDGRRVATHWRHAEALRDRFPDVIVEPEALFVRDGPYSTSGGIASGIDLALALVEEDLGTDAARTVAQVLIVFMQRPGGQSQFSARTVVGSVRHATLRDLLDAVVVDPAGDHSLSAMAERASFSDRHLTRLFADQLGTTPARYVEKVRVESARGLLERTDESLDTVAGRCGFGSAETMRRAFLKHLGVAPGVYRSHFRTTGIHG